jgi:UDPglucose 6-dehydrogenase
VLCTERDDALTGADALVICTEWRQFKSPDFELMRSELSEHVIFDGRNIYDPARVMREGFVYYGIGLGAPGKEPATTFTGDSPLLAQAAAHSS